MTPTTIIREAQAEGVRLALSDTGTLKATGDQAVVARWLPTIKTHKPAIVAALQEAANESAAPMIASEEAVILAWLEYIGETDPATIAEVLTACWRNLEARRYFTWRAAELPKPDPFLDDRRTCAQCDNLIGRRCQAAKRGEIAASWTYEPNRDQLRRCEGYALGAGDPNRRHGRERWPGLIQKGGQ